MKWEPIETAPMDATLVLLHKHVSGTDTFAAAYWDSDRQMWFLDKFRRSYMPEPTHWMSIPSAPQIETSRE